MTDEQKPNQAEYTSYDFSECLKSADRDSAESGPKPEDVESVLFAWGKNDDGWGGGFILALKDGRFCMITGWCDYTGWG